MEPGQRKSIALTKFQQAGKATIDKIKKQKSESKVPKQQGFDVVQIGSLLFAAWIVLWIVAASVVSAVFFVRYIGIVEDNQAWYLQHGSARSAAAETTAVLQAAIEAKEALIASINYGLIKTSYDYAAIESTLAPTLLLQPFVRTFDITFSDRTAGLHIRHQPGEGGRQLILQSNAEDCYLLGTQGCADLGVQPQRFPAWHTDAMFLNMSFEGHDLAIEGFGARSEAEIPPRSFLQGIYWCSVRCPITVTVLLLAWVSCACDAVSKARILDPPRVELDPPSKHNRFSGCLYDGTMI
ncbi:unnamed protein product [Symbiodinium sp. KB8]|nr:unnamed protein product [Symbiodinium sp. KB8]